MAKQTERKKERDSNKEMSQEGSVGEEVNFMLREEIWPIRNDAFSILARDCYLSHAQIRNARTG